MNPAPGAPSRPLDVGPEGAELGKTEIASSPVKDASGLDDAAIDIAVRSKQIDFLFRQGIVIPVNLVIAGGTAAVVWRLYPGWLLALWLELFCIVILGRYLLGYRYASVERGAGTTVLWGRLFTLGAFLTGCLWGLTGSIVFVTPNPIDHVFIVFVLGGMVAAGIVGNAASLPAMFGFVLPSILPMIVALVSRQAFVKIEMALMLAAFTAVLSAVGLNTHRSIVENIRLRVTQSVVVVKLRISEAALAQAQAMAHIGSWEADVATGRLTWSPEIFRILGLDPATYSPSIETVTACVHPDDRPAFGKYYADTIATGAPHTLDHRVVTADGATKWVHEIAQATPNAGGPPLHLFGTTQDVTERKTTGDTLQFANILLTTEMEASPEGILVVGTNRNVISFNQRFSDMWNVPPAMLAAGDDVPVLAKVSASVKNQPEFLAQIQYLTDHPDEMSIDEIQTTDGRFIDRHTRGLRAPDGEHLGRVWFFHDVTKEREAANALLYRDRLLHAVTAGMSILVAAESLDQGMPEALRVVGESLQVDRILVIQAGPDQDFRLALRHVWQAPDLQTPFDLSTFEDPSTASAAMIDWSARLKEGKSVIAQLASSEGSIRATLERFQSKSVLMVPIVVNNQTWGSLSADACKVTRDWTAHEIDTLNSFAGITGSLIRRNEAQLSLEISEERFRVLSATARDAIVTIDGAGLISQWNRSAEGMLGYGANEVMGKPVHAFIVPARFKDQADRALKIFLETGQGDVVGKTVELFALRKDGTEVEIEVSLAGTHIGGLWQAMAILRDVTERKRSEQLILQMARFDLLTGLANRSVFVGALGQAIEKAKRGEKRFAVIYLDLDHFKDVNDTLGHPVGDELLKAVAARLRANTLGADTVARFGGDEFAVVAADIDEPADAGLLATKLIRSISEPFTILGSDIHTGVSVGIDLYGPEAPDAETLLSHADVALYRAKSEGRGTYRFFTEAMDTEVRRRVTLGGELREAVGSGQLFLLYQPQVAIDSGRVIGLEALVRWRHPERGILHPDVFIPVAEKAGIITKLGQWVLRTACRQAKAWLDAGLIPIRIAVNVSALQFKTPLGLETDVTAILKETGLPPRQLELELTESALMDVSREHGETLARLRQVGITIAIDDFGTGYSSLDYLRRYPVDRIKIAQNFVKHLATMAGNAAIVKATLGLARELGISVIAEGVETPEQLALLKKWGCVEIQGFYFAKPVAVEEITRLLQDGGILKPRAALAGPKKARADRAKSPPSEGT
jgi:diguanylate cyclase (GGDEF)-like protein/PAS domain S-box-containing protein